MGKKKKPVVTGPRVMVLCPWGCGPVPRDKYGEHLQTVHYKKEKGKVLGPFPAGTKEAV